MAFWSQVIGPRIGKSIEGVLEIINCDIQRACTKMQVFLSFSKILALSPQDGTTVYQ